MRYWGFEQEKEQFFLSCCLLFKC
uniref:Uncharacterized protein n=1 Tax=Rhizophora mucronata TaxID=61149 RepID=A0A2P2N1W0_RHIMU